MKTGLSNFDALSIGTRNAGEFVRRYIDEDAHFGQVEIGYRADLLLLAENPLDDVRNASRVEAVAVNGRWFENSELDHRRETLAARFTALNDVNEQVDAALEGREYLIGSFSAADIMLGHSLFMANRLGQGPDELANLKGYLKRIEARPAFQTAINL